MVRSGSLPAFRAASFSSASDFAALLLRQTALLSPPLASTSTASSPLQCDFTRELAALHSASLLQGHPLREDVALLPPPPSALHRLLVASGTVRPYGAAEKRSEMKASASTTEAPDASASSRKEEIRRKLALRVAKSMPPALEDNTGATASSSASGNAVVAKKERRLPSGDAVEGGQGCAGDEQKQQDEEEQFICPICKKDFRRPDILSR